MHGWDMPIKPVDIDLEGFEQVTVCSPIWVFTACGPVKAFCRECSGRIKSVDYIIVHHTNGSYEKAADELDGILGIKRSALCSVRCRKGEYKTLGQN